MCPAVSTPQSSLSVRHRLRVRLTAPKVSSLNPSTCSLHRLLNPSSAQRPDFGVLQRFRGRPARLLERPRLLPSDLLADPAPGRGYYMLQQKQDGDGSPP